MPGLEERVTLFSKRVAPLKVVLGLLMLAVGTFGYNDELVVKELRVVYQYLWAGLFFVAGILLAVCAACETMIAGRPVRIRRAIQFFAGTVWLAFIWLHGDPARPYFMDILALICLGAILWTSIDDAMRCREAIMEARRHEPKPAPAAPKPESGFVDGMFGHAGESG